MSRMKQLLQGSVLAIALAIIIYPTQQAQLLQPYHTSEMANITLNNAEPSPDYGIFYLVQQWPKTYCFNRTICRGPIPSSRFTIHGLWPQSANGSRYAPRWCCKDNSPRCRFNFTSIENLSNELDRVWPNLVKNGTNDERFWESQWEKHGSCSLGEVNQVDYFEAAIKLYHTFNLFTILKDFIENQTSHEVWEIKEAIVKKTKMEALFRCQFYNETANYVSEIIMCVNHHASGFQSCDSARDSPSRRAECMKGKKVIFP